MIGGLSGLANLGNIPSLSSMISLVQGLNPNSSYQQIGIDLSGDQLNQELANFGIQLPETIDYEAMQAAMTEVNEMESYNAEANKLKADRMEQDITDAKTEYFKNNHYEWPTNSQGEPDYSKEPKVVTGAENDAQAAQRAKYERMKLEEVQDANLEASKSGNYPKGSKRAELAELQKDSSALQAMLATEEGSAKYSQLMADAQKEATNQDLYNREAELLATTPPALHGQVKDMTQTCIDNNAAAAEVVANSDAAKVLADFQAAIAAYTAQLRANITGSGLGDNHIMGYDASGKVVAGVDGADESITFS